MGWSPSFAQSYHDQAGVLMRSPVSIGKRSPSTTAQAPGCPSTTKPTEQEEIMATTVRGSAAPFSAYYKRDVPEPDKELTQYGPGTPGGEYLRRFWQPVGTSGDLKDLPRPVRIMGEDLVLFRDG